MQRYGKGIDLRKLKKVNNASWLYIKYSVIDWNWEGAVSSDIVSYGKYYKMHSENGLCYYSPV